MIHFVSLDTKMSDEPEAKKKRVEEETKPEDGDDNAPLPKGWEKRMSRSSGTEFVSNCEGFGGQVAHLKLSQLHQLP